MSRDHYKGIPKNRDARVTPNGEVVPLSLKDEDPVTGGVNVEDLKSSSGDVILDGVPVPNAVNRLQVRNATTSSGVSLTATGDDANVDINAFPKGTGRMRVGNDILVQGRLDSVFPDDQAVSLDGSQANEAGILSARFTGTPLGSRTVSIKRMGVVAGSVHTTVSGATALVEHDQEGGFTFGWCGAYHDGGVAETINALGFGGIAGGTSWSTGANSIARIKGNNRHLLTFGYTVGASGGTGEILGGPTATSRGAVAFGQSWGQSGQTSQIITNNQGAFASGAAFATNATTVIKATGFASMARGRAQNAAIEATSLASHASGASIDGSSVIKSTSAGSFAHGYAHDGGVIEASGKGSFAIGYADAGQLIAASGTNTFQFGPGSNALADSFKIGSAGLRFKGTVGAPTTPENGDFWVDGSGNVLVRTNGTTKNLSNIT